MLQATDAVVLTWRGLSGVKENMVHPWLILDNLIMVIVKRDIPTDVLS